MKKINPKDMPKLVALVVLAVLVFGYAAVQFTSGPTAGAASKPAAPADENDKTAADNASGAAAGTSPADAFNVADVALLTSGKDPFVPNGPAAPTPLLPPAPPAAPIAPLAPPKPAVAIAALPGNGTVRGGLPPFFGGGNAPAPVAPVAPAPVKPTLPPVPEYVVTGIVRDETPDVCSNKVAILRGGAGDADRRFVRCGDSVGNGFKVIAVRKDGIEIESGDRRVTLKLGASR